MMMMMSSKDSFFPHHLSSATGLPWKITEYKKIDKFSHRQHIALSTNNGDQYFIYTQVLSIQVSVRQAHSMRSK